MAEGGELVNLCELEAHFAAAAAECLKRVPVARSLTWRLALVAVVFVAPVEKRSREWQNPFFSPIFSSLERNTRAGDRSIKRPVATPGGGEMLP